MKNQQSISTEAWQNLLNDQGGLCVSLVLPMEERGPETRKNSIALKTGLKRARELLVHSKWAGDKIDALLEPAEDLIDNEDFWQHQSRTLVIYLSEKSFRPFILKESFPEYVSIGERYYLLPLLQSMSGRDLAFLLTLSHKHVRLYRWTHGHLSEEEVPDLPANMEAALQLESEQGSRSAHVISTDGGGRGGEPVLGPQGHGARKDTRVAHLRGLVQAVEKAVTAHLRRVGHDAPLVVATLPETFTFLREVSTYVGLVDQPIEGNFDHASEDELAGHTGSALGALESDERREALESMRDNVAQGNGTIDLDEAIRAANQGRVGVCAIAMDSSPRTGRWDETNFRAQFDEEVDPRNPDLVDFAAVSSWQHGGTVLFVPREEMPEGADVAVSYRFSIDPKDNPGNP